MLSQIVVEGENPLTIPVAGATPKSSLLIRKITGLNPADLDLFLGEYARDGGVYQGRRTGFRNIVMTLDLNPNPALGESVSSLRETLYKAFMNPTTFADYVKINFHRSESDVRYIVGYVEKFETELFDVETSAQISMICPDPYFRAEYPSVEAPGEATSTLYPTYNGTAPVGFEMDILINSAISSLQIDNNYQASLPNVGRMNITRNFTPGEVVNLVTIRGERSLKISGSSILSGLSSTSQWLDLHPQGNELTVSTGAFIQELRYREAYWGI